jgi:hypothetical protein
MNEDEVEEHLQGLLLESFHGKNGKTNGKVTVGAK